MAGGQGRSSLSVQRNRTDTHMLSPWQKEADELFISHDIAEIKEIEKRTRQKVEQKREELRHMVGQRYRDLINAADTILDMGQSAQSTVEAVTRLQDSCSRIGESVACSKSMQRTVHTHPHSGILLAESQAEGKAADRQRTFYAVCTTMKLLVDTPEHIWKALESTHHLQAALLYCLARHLYTGLQVNTSLSTNLLSAFPVIAIQWHAIASFKMEILAGCRAQLGMVYLPPIKIAQALVAIMLLENNYPKQALDELLKARTTTLQRLLSIQSEGQVKDQIRDIVTLTSSTLYHCAVLFGSRPISNQHPCLLLEVLKECTTANQNGVNSQSPEKDWREGQDVACTTLSKLYGHSSDTLTLLKHLPDTLVNYAPERSPLAATPLSKEALQNTCCDWLDSCREIVSEQLPLVLNHVTTHRALAVCRDTVWNAMREGFSTELDNSVPADEASQLQTANSNSEQGGNNKNKMTPLDVQQQWEAIHEVVCGDDAKFSLWNFLLRPLFVAHATELLQRAFHALPGKLDALLSNQLQTLTSGPIGCDYSVARYTWQEHDTDLQPFVASEDALSLAADISSSSRLTGLAVKAAGLTPAAYNVCLIWDQWLAQILADLQYSLGDVTRQLSANESKASLAQRKSGRLSMARADKQAANPDWPFDKYGEAGEVQDCAVSLCVRCVGAVCDDVETRLGGASDMLANQAASPEVLLEATASALFLGQVVQALAWQSRQLPELLMSQHGHSQGLAEHSPRFLLGQRGRHTRTESTSLPPPLSPSLSLCREKLSSVATQSLFLWVDHTAAETISQFEHSANLTYYSDARNFVWHTVSIDDEVDESQSSVSISLPGRESTFIIDTLYGVCLKISHSIGWAQDSSAVLRLAAAVAEGAVSHFKTLAESDAIGQSGAVQILFDLRLLTALLAGRAASGMAALQSREVEMTLYQKIDPFDLSLLLPYLDKTVMEILRRSANLLGALCAATSLVPASANSKASPYTSDETSVVPLATCQQRLDLLPVAALSTPTQRKNSSRYSPNALKGRERERERERDRDRDSTQSSSTTPQTPRTLRMRQSLRSNLVIGEQASKWVEKGLQAGGESLRSLWWGSQGGGDVSTRQPG